MTRMKRLTILILLGLAATTAPAQDKYPAKPIKVVVPFGPGSATDIVMRIVGEQMRPILGQPVVVENKPGAFGILAIEEMARAKSDGYTLQIGNPGTNVLTPIIYKKKFKIDYDKDVILVTRLSGDSTRARRHDQGLPAQNLCRVHRLRQGQSRQGALCQRRRRQQQSLRHGSLRPMGRHRAHALAEQGRRRRNYQ